MTNPEMTYHPNGKIKTIIHRNANGKLHNLRGPAIISYNDNGQKECEVYYKDGKYHNDKGPAIIKYYDNGQKEYEGYYKDGKWHNVSGPALISYSDNGHIAYEEYWVSGKQLTKEKFMTKYQKKDVLPEPTPVNNFIDLDHMALEMASEFSFDEPQRMVILDALKLAFNAGFKSFKAVEKSPLYIREA